MKRGKTGLKSRLLACPSQDERAMNQKWGASRLPQVPPVDWGSLPHHIVLQIFQHLSLVDRARASSVCRCWNSVFHTPDLWRRFEFELNQPATSYLRSTHPDLIQQIIKKHAQHLQYVSFKVRNLSLICSPPPPFSQHTSPVVYTICCRTSHDTSAAMASSTLTHHDGDYSYISDLDCYEYTVCIF